MNYLVTFADSRLARSLSRIAAEASSLAFFDYVLPFDEGDLSSEFYHKFRDRLVAGSRGFGYWCWKPEVIKMAINKMSAGDCLLYVDSGCRLNSRGIERLRFYFDMLKASESGVLAFQAKPPTIDISPLNYDGRTLMDQRNYRWTKGDLFDFFGVRNDPTFTHSQAIGAGIILFKKGNKAIELIDEWSAAIDFSFALIDDSPSVSPNLPGFIEHRHDQALFSILCLKHMVPTLSAYEYWYPKPSVHSNRLEPDWNALRDFPLHACRDKDYGFLRNSLFKMRRALARLIF
jgi:hypothetical protein